MTVREMIHKRYGDNYTVFSGRAMELSVDNGVEVEEWYSGEYVPVKHIAIFPHIEYTDGYYRPSYSSDEYRVHIEIEEDDNWERQEAFSAGWASY